MTLPELLSDYDERRRGLRKPLRTSASFSWLKETPIEVRTWDLSVNGICLISSVNLSRGTPCLISFSLPFKDGTFCGLNLPGKVAYSMYSGDLAGFKIGLEFTLLNDLCRAAIELFLHG